MWLRLSPLHRFSGVFQGGMEACENNEYFGGLGKRKVVFKPLEESQWERYFTHSNWLMSGL